MRSTLLAGLFSISLLGLGSTSTSAQGHASRQYYGGWHQHASRSYYYRTYYYKPAPTYYGYKHHYVIYYPSRPSYVYYYNPYSKRYWGRCPIKSEGVGEYSMLAEADRKASLDDIPEKAFPPLGKMPKIPEAKDDAVMDLPPDDLPATENLPK